MKSECTDKMFIDQLTNQPNWVNKQNIISEFSCPSLVNKIISMFAKNFELPQNMFEDDEVNTNSLRRLSVT